MSQTHPLPGSAHNLPTDEAAWVGTEGDPDRRRHRFAFAGAAVAVSEAGLPELFVTVAMARTVMVSGAYGSRMAVTPELRMPDEVVGDQGTNLARPLAGLSFIEAETICELLGGALPDEKVFDYVFVGLSASLEQGGETRQAWTASSWSAFSYSLAWYDARMGAWRAPKTSMFGSPQAGRTIFEMRGPYVTRRSSNGIDNAAVLTPIVYAPLSGAGEGSSRLS